MRGKVNSTSKNLDLHGLVHSEAIELVENELLLASTEPGFIFNIITGNSSTLQEKIIRQVLDKYEFNYYITAHNLGKITVVDDKYRV